MATDVNDAVEFMRLASEAESDNRARAMIALKFRYGDQWEPAAMNSRSTDRPRLTINETDTYIKKVVNGIRSQRPRGRASPVDDNADVRTAKVITGLGRHVEVNSDADNAYDVAADFAATMGWGYWRVRADYISEDSFNQDVFIDTIVNPFSTFRDPDSKLPDGSDADKGLITDLMKLDLFRSEYPDAQAVGFSEVTTGIADPDWITEHDIRVAEYFYIERVKAKLVMLTDGTVIWADELNKAKRIMASMGIGVKGERESFKRTVRYCKQTQFDILEERTLPGKWIPIVPMFWTSVIIDGKRRLQGMVENMMDPARMVNFWQTAITETLAMAPKPKWLATVGATETFDMQYKNANVSAMALLQWNHIVDGVEQPEPKRISPDPVPAGLVEAAFLASQSLSRVAGVFDPAVRGGAQHKSDSTLNAEQGQSEMTNFEGYDNQLRSIKHTWRIMLSYFPAILDVEQVKRIIGDDGRDSLVTINQKVPDPEDESIQKVLNDMTVGTYDVVMEVGPGYDTKRREGVAATMELMNTPIGEKVAAVADDLIVRQMDFPGADAIADRLAAANPLSQIDETSPIPPQVQMKLKAQEQQIQQLTQQLQGAAQEIKFRGGIEQMKQDNENKRELMRNTTKAHDVEERNKSMQHSTEVKGVTAQNVAEINGLVQLLIKNIDTKHLEAEIAQRDREQQAKDNESASSQPA